MKGETRRIALLDAVVRVLERGGPGAVTHRSVAAEAGVPVAAATYYFATLDDLYVSALRRATEGQVALFDELAAGSLRDFARVLHRWAIVERASAIAQYELLFLAMRRDALRDAADAWYGSLEQAMAASGIDEPARSVIAFAADGLMLRILWTGEPGTVDLIEAALRNIVSVAPDSVAPDSEIPAPGPTAT